MEDPEKSKEQLLDDLAGAGREIKSLRDKIAHYEQFEKALPDSGQQYWSLIQTMHDGMVVQNEKGIFVFVNDNIADKLGYSKAELIGHRASDFVHESSRDSLKKQMEMRRHNRGGAYEIILKRKDGGKMYAIASGSPLIGPDGEYRGSFALITDITDRKLAEEALKISEDRYRKVVENAREGIVVIRDNHVVFANRRAEEILGNEFRELTSIPFSELLFPADRERVTEEFASLINGPVEFKQMELCLLDRDGKEKWLESNMVPISWENESAVLMFFNDIGRRRTMEKALRESESRYRTLVETSPDAIALVDISGKLIMGNRRLAELFDFNSVDSMLGLDVMDLVYPEDREKALLNSRLIIESSETVNVEFRLAKKDGNPFFADISTVMVKETGKETATRPSTFIAIIRDITLRKNEETELHKYRHELEDLVNQRTSELKKTNVNLEKEIEERKNIEHSLRESESKYRLLVDNVPEVITLIDPNGKVLFVNDVGTRDMHAPAGEIIGKTLWDYFPREVADDHMESIRTAIDSGEEVYEEARSIIDGQVRWHDTTIHPIEDEGGEIYCVMIIARDITQRKHADELVRESEEKYRALVEATDTGYIILDADCNVIDANSEYVRMSGHTKLKDIRGRNVLEWTFPSVRDKSQAGFDRCLEQGYIRNFEIEFGQPDGKTIPVEINARVVDSDEGTRILALCRDVSEKRRDHEALLESEEFSRAIIEHSPIGISIRSRTGRLLGYNQAWQEIWSIPDDEIRRYLKNENYSLDFDEHDSYLGEWLEKVEKIYLEGGYLHVPEVQSKKHRSGKQHWLSQHFYALKNTSGEVNRVIILTEDITNRKIAENALRESEKRFRELADLLPQTVFETNIEGFITFSNTQGFVTSGFSREDLEKGIHVLDLFPPEEKERVVRRMQERLAGMPVENHEFTMQTKAGKKIPVLIYSAPIIKDDRPIGLRGVAVDISNRKSVEEALRASENLYSATINAMHDAIHVIDADLKVTLFSKSFREWFLELDFDDTDAIGKNLKDVFPFLSDRVFEEYAEVIKSGRTMITEEKTKVGDREIITESKKIPIFEGERVISVVTVIRDITEKKLAEEELKRHRDDLEELVRERAAELSQTNIRLTQEVIERRRTEDQLRDSEERYRLLFESASDGILIASTKDYRLKYANPSFCRFLGYSADEIQKLTIRDIHPPESLDDVIKEFQSIAAGDKILAENTPVVRKDGSIVYADISGTQAMVDGEECNIGYFRDITERRLAERALKESEERFRMLSEATSEGILTHDQGKIIDFNEKMTEMFGYTSEELFKLNLADLAAPDYVAFVNETMAKEGEIAEQGMAIRKDGTLFPVEVSGKSCRYHGKTMRILAFRDLTEHKRAENELIKTGEELRMEREALEEKNIALREVLGQIEAEKTAIKQQIAANVERIILPSLRRFKDRCTKPQVKHIENIESSLQTITSPFTEKLRSDFSRLTPREMEICQMIKNGLQSKEISEILNISILTIHKHREIIRKKLGLKNKNINLSSYLQSL